MKRPKLTREVLDKIHKKLMESAAPVTRNRKGEPCYLLYFTGTKRELKTLQKKLRALE